MAKKQQRGGRTTPKGTRPAGTLARGRDPVDELIDDAGRDLRRASGPLDPEIFGSGLLGMVEDMEQQAEEEGIEAPPVVEMVLLRCAQRKDRASLLVAAALAAVLDDDDLATAKEVVDVLAAGGGAPGWLDQVGAAEATRAWRGTDVWGDAESIMVAFRHPGSEDEHVVVVLLNHNLDGQALDVWIALEPDRIVEDWRTGSDGHELIEEVPVDDALRRAEAALAAAHAFPHDDFLRDEGYKQHKGLLTRRIRRHGIGAAEHVDLEVSEDERDELVAAFLASEHAAAVAGCGGDVPFLAGALLDLRADHEGRPLRWSPIVVEELLLELAPRRVQLDGPNAAALPAVLRAVVRWAGERTGLDERWVDETVAAVDEHEAGYLERTAAPAAE